MPINYNKNLNIVGNTNNPQDTQSLSYPTAQTANVPLSQQAAAVQPEPSVSEPTPVGNMEQSSFTDRAMAFWNDHKNMIIAILILMALAGGAWWWFKKQSA